MVELWTIYKVCNFSPAVWPGLWPSGGKNPRFVTQMSKPIFPAKRARFDSLGRHRKKRLKRIHFKAASMHSRQGGEYLTFGQSWILYSWFYF